ncbi:S1 family peptidase [Actinokineospora globicatena]|uniref:Trypsin n=1 Tax=Actinokineospora globicatena TaxID=103729 RepID=A0A9W6QL20_9PSEU|nr:S1 family peptidase [Actinokineospora globicatena]GLW90524.1 trypsin [Actinokineospora globicatena]
MRLKNVLISLVGAALALTGAALPATASPTQPAIIGGGYAQTGPWAVAIMVNGQQNCSGSIIAARWVITAKHCANSANRFYIGNVDRDAGQSRTAVRSVSHPSADIILYQLNSSVSTTYVPLTTSAPTVGSSEQVYGYGRTESARDSRYLKVATMRVTRVTSGFIDATKGTGYTGPGDSGGPVLQNGKLIGVHSYGDTTAGTSGHVNVYTYRQWILANATG